MDDRGAKQRVGRRRLGPPVPKSQLRAALERLRGDPRRPVDASVAIPVNAQGDLHNVLRVVGDLARYDGKASVEIILVVNNFPPEEPPKEIDDLRRLGLRVVAVPDVRRHGEAVGFSARIVGVEAAGAEAVISFDADCRIPEPRPLIDWYVEQFRTGAGAAYSPVGHYDYDPKPGVYVHFAVHHVSRWFKRTLLRIPTTRGSNYGVARSVALDLYAKKMLADEMNVGPTFKAQGHRVAYSGRRQLVVLTSGRMFSGRWVRLLPYFWYRLRYNLRTLPVRQGVAQRTGRENDPVRRYVDNRPVR